MCFPVTIGGVAPWTFGPKPDLPYSHMTNLNELRAENKRLKEEILNLRLMFRVNMLRNTNIAISHEEITEILNTCIPKKD